VVRPACVETTAMGAAYLAGLAVGFWSDRADIVRNREPDEVFRPQREFGDMRAARRDWARALERAKGWGAPE
jgi:glycerol kinase